MNKSETLVVCYQHSCISAPAYGYRRVSASEPEFTCDVWVNFPGTFLLHEASIKLRPGDLF